MISSTIDNASSSMKNCINQKLMALLAQEGFTPEELSAVASATENANVDTTTLKATAEEKYSNTLIKAEEKILTNAKVTKAKSENEATRQTVANHDVQDALKDLRYKEPIASDTKFTSPVDLPDASYTIKESYPQTHGKIDIAHNWIKVNKDTKYLEFIHGTSGSGVKIDRDGNTTVYIAGNLKVIIDKEATVEVGLSTDVSIGANFYKHVVGNTELSNDGNVNETTVGNSVSHTQGQRISLVDLIRILKSIDNTTIEGRNIFLN